MGHEVVSEAKCGTISFDADRKILKLKWNSQPLSIGEYKAMYRTCLSFQKERQVDYFLSDARDQPNLNDEYQSWFEKSALEIAVAQGLQKAAVIIDGNAVKIYYLNTISHISRNFGLPFMAFKTEEAAVEWFVATL